MARNKKLQEAKAKVTIQMIDDLYHGGEVELNDVYSLYFSLDEDRCFIIVTETFKKALEVEFFDDIISFNR